MKHAWSSCLLGLAAADELVTRASSGASGKVVRWKTKDIRAPMGRRAVWEAKFSACNVHIHEDCPKGPSQVFKIQYHGHGSFMN